MALIEMDFALGNGGGINIEKQTVTGIYGDGGNHNLSTPSGIIADQGSIVSVFTQATTYKYTSFATIVDGVIDTTYSYGGYISVDSNGQIFLRCETGGDSYKIILTKTS